MKTPILICMLLSATVGFSQQTINDTIMHDGLQRAYILYVPASYSSGTAVPLVMNFHGYTSNSSQQMLYGDFRSIADTAGFIIVHPMGTVDSTGQPYWNANWGGPADDIGFTAALIDSLSAQYTIDQSRVFSTGMSNGGFMSYTLACELSNRIAAIASVTGTMIANQFQSCNPQHPMPIMEIHGTSDPTVPYAGNTIMEAIPDVLNYWAAFNNCDATPTITNVPDIDITDGSTAEHFLYSNGDNGVEVEHYKIIGGEHTWPGASFIIGVTNYDIDASEKIWQFFAKYDINGRIPLGIEDGQSEAMTLEVYPNPSTDQFRVSLTEKGDVRLQITDVTGKVIENRSISNTDNFSIEIESSPGIYFLEVISKDERRVAKLVKR